MEDIIQKDLRDWVGYHAETAFSRYFRIFYGYPTSRKTTKPKIIVLLTKVTGPKKLYSLLADINTKTCFTNDLGQNSQVISVSAKSFRRQKVFHLV